jgi:HD-GYP domain-containing protein (c-di-GMP phosphodiesterase class II)
MYQRIAVGGDNEALLNRLAQAAKGSRTILFPIHAGQIPPPGTAAVAVPAEAFGPALDSILAVGAEQEELLYLLADAVDCRESIPLGSARRFREHATRFARAVNLSQEDQFVLERATILRDIGKIRLSNELLLKSSVLDYDEWMLLKAHSHLGAELLRERNVSADVADIVQYHHECYDGDGYPEHLEKDAIPLLARMLRVIDVYCAMTSPRHYRASLATHEQGIEHLTKERGKHFDPALVDAFIKANVGHTATP